MPKAHVDHTCTHIYTQREHTYYGIILIHTYIHTKTHTYIHTNSTHIHTYLVYTHAFTEHERTSAKGSSQYLIPHTRHNYAHT